MTLRWLDSFDHYTAIADIGRKYNQGTPTYSGVGDDGFIIVTDGRFGNALEVRRSNSTPGAADYAGKIIPGMSHATIIVGFAYRFSSFTTPDRVIFHFKETSTVHVDIRHGSTNALYFTRAGTSLSVFSSVLSPDTWYYIEAKVVIHNSAGSVAFRVNEVASGSGSGLDTQNGGSGVVNAIQLGFGTTAIAGTDIIAFDDLYVCDGAGSVNNDFLGDTRVQAIFPNGNGNSSQLVGSDGNSTDNYLLVNETAPNVADYVESSTVGDKDTYPYGNLTPVSGIVRGVQIIPEAAKTDAGTRSIVSVARLSGTEEDSAAKTLSTTIQYHPDIRETKPGGGAWGVSDVNSAEFGYKVNA